MRIFPAALTLCVLVAPVGASACDLEAEGFGRFSPFQSSWEPPPEAQPQPVAQPSAPVSAADYQTARAETFAREMFGVGYTPALQEDIGPARTN
jgi:hypothetical protein